MEACAANVHGEWPKGPANPQDLRPTGIIGCIGINKGRDFWIGVTWRRDATMPLPRLIMVGGFLGAGKTTLLAQAATRLARQGKRVGLVTNDQASELVDTALLRDGGSVVEEVPDGCFCCRFQDLIAAVERIEDLLAADVILTEPVGSCTDLSATVLQPLKKIYAERFCLAPLSVLVDPGRLREVFEEKGHAEKEERNLLCEASSESRRQKVPVPVSAAAGFFGHVLYILRKQLEESDVIVLNKTDLLAGAELESLRALLREHFPGVPVFPISATNGEGVDSWLEFVVQDRQAGTRIADVDYDVYAAGEASLAWLNASLRVHARGEADWGLFCWKLIDALQHEFRASAAEVAHLKIRLTADGGAIMAHLTANRARPLLFGHLTHQPHDAALLLNARVHMDPEQLRAIVESCLRATAADGFEIAVDQIRSFSPSRPQPTHRFDRVVQAD
jgi:G3E family GTPase